MARRQGAGSAAAVSDAQGGVVLRVHVHPGASRAGVDPVDPWRQAFPVRVRARARGGEANQEVLSVVAEALGVPATAVSLRAGHRAREKDLFVAGLDAAEVRRRLEGRP